MKNSMTDNNQGLHNNALKFLDETRWKAGLDYSDIGVWELNTSDNEIFLSSITKKIIGFETDEDFGNKLEDWNIRVHPNDKQNYLKTLKKHLDGITPIFQCEYRIKCKNDTYKWILDRGIVITWFECGKPKKIIGTVTDISNSHIAKDKTIKALNLATEQNNKLRNFAHIVTHNLKQHAGNFESLLNFYKEAETEEEKNELITHLKTVSESLTKTITNLNQVVSVQSEKNKKTGKIYIAKEVDDILNSLDFVISENKATIHNNLDPRLYIYYNCSYFESIIQNLLTNAIKYRHPDRDPIITINNTFEKNFINLSVSDNGRGIDLDKFGKDVFGLYKTFHYNEDSEGVGLYLIKNQIETFGGEITVSSVVGEGTTFHIKIKNTKM